MINREYILLTVKTEIPLTLRVTQTGGVSTAEATSLSDLVAATH